MNKDVINSLKKILIDSYALYTKTQNYHWNVEGPQFKAIHDLLENQYDDLAVAIDDIAEMIRSLGEKISGTWWVDKYQSNITIANENADAQTMIKHLLEDQKNLVDSLLKAVQISQQAGDEIVAGFLTERATVHRKNHWMLNSVLK